jgi:hypothetical protein
MILELPRRVKNARQGLPLLNSPRVEHKKFPVRVNWFYNLLRHSGLSLMVKLIEESLDRLPFKY